MKLSWAEISPQSPRRTQRRINRHGVAGDQASSFFETTTEALRRREEVDKTWKTAQHGSSHPKKGFGLVCLIFLFLVTSCSTISGWFEKPGEGAKASLGYQTCEPVIQALEKYRAQRAAYPEKLESLAPDFLAAVPATVNNYPVEYSASGTSYKLSFRYTGPGMNTCVYTPENKWRCTGYY
jgi:hypothetical protein